MEKIKKEDEKTELLTAIKNSIKDGRDTATKMAQLLRECIQPLRMGGNVEVFNDLAQHIRDLQCFLEFIMELKGGINHFKRLSLPEDPISSHQSGLNLFKEMQSAFEVKDWITLSDLIEYELCPLLIKEDEWLGTLDEKLQGM